MARIRSIHPEQWTDDRFVTCSPLARLLAIGIRNEADDNGVFEWNPIKLKMRILPADNCDVAQLLTELTATNQVLQFEASGKAYGLIRSFQKYQKPKKPTFYHPVPTEPLPNGYALSASYSGTGSLLVPNQSRKSCVDGEEEGKGEKGEYVSTAAAVEGDNAPALAAPAGSNEDGCAARDRNSGRTEPPSCPHDEIIALYHEILPMCQQVREWNKQRQGYLRQRWRESPKRQNIDWWRQYFAWVAESKFLTGQRPGTNGRPPFIASLEWLILPSNMAEVIEGKYHRDQAA